MRFFLVARDRSTGEVRLVADVTYESRDEALAVLGGESASDEYSAYDLFVVDLDAVSPVVFYRAPAAAPAPPVELPTEAAVEEPIADVWEAPLADSAAGGEAEEAGEGAEEEPDEAVGETPEVAEEAPEAAEEAPEVAAEATEEPAAPALEEGAWTGERTVEDIEGDLEVAESSGQPAEAPAEDVEEAWPSGSLADALRAAASSMEESGVVAPPSVEEYASAGSLTDLEESVSEEVIAPSEEAESAPAAMAAHPEMWPWEAEGADVAPADEPAPAEEPADTESVLAAIAAFGRPEEVPASDDRPAAVEEEAAAGTAEVLAAEAEPAAAAELAEEPEPEAVDAASPVPYVPVGIEEAGMEEISLLTPADPSFELDEGMSPLELPSEEAPALDAVAAGEPAPSDEVAEGAAAGDGRVYEPGEVDIATYTCDDCVYVETCPKNHQDGPSTCGAFQWKPV